MAVIPWYFDIYIKFINLLIHHGIDMNYVYFSCFKQKSLKSNKLFNNNSRTIMFSGCNTMVFYAFHIPRYFTECYNSF